MKQHELYVFFWIFSVSCRAVVQFVIQICCYHYSLFTKQQHKTHNVSTPLVGISIGAIKSRRQPCHSPSSV